MPMIINDAPGNHRGGAPLRLPAEATAVRVAARVDRQFERGIVQEVRTLLASGVPREARPFGGLVYRQVMEMLRGVRGENKRS